MYIMSLNLSRAPTYSDETKICKFLLILTFTSIWTCNACLRLIVVTMIANYDSPPPQKKRKRENEVL